VKATRGKSRRPSQAPPQSRRPKPPLDLRLATFFLWLLVLVPPFVLAQVAKENFREPKLMVSEWLALASLVCLAWGLRRVERVRLADLWRLPAVRLVLPVLLVATAGLATTRHPLQARDGLVDLWIGAACLVGWSVALPPATLDRLLRGLLVPATVLGLIGIVQFYGLWQPLEFFGLAAGSRMATTSLAGNPWDLSAYTVLPALVAQASLRRRLREGEIRSRPQGVWGMAAVLVILVYAILITQTLAAVAALALGSLLLWGSLLPRRRALAVLAAGALAAAVLVMAIAPLRQRVVMKARQAAAGDWNSVLTGRLDGWRAAVWMLERHPLAGVGHGGYLPEFVPAKLDLIDHGVRFFPDPSLAVFSNAHNEILTAAAEWGLPGLLAVAWMLWVVLGALRRMEPEERVLGGAGVAALTILSLASFPFHVALVAFPVLLFLSWVFRASSAESRDAGAGVQGSLLVWPVLALLVLGLAGQTARWHRRWTASGLLRQVELLSMAAASRGQAPAQLMERNLEALRRAAPLHPDEVGIPIARGTQYLFLGRPEAAIRAYEEALALEPRPEGYLNLGRAQWLAGRREEARRSFVTAVRLDPRLAAEIPAPAR
jgi:O-antigen ligase